MPGAASWAAVVGALQQAGAQGLTCLSGVGWDRGNVLTAAPTATVIGPAAAQALDLQPSVLSREAGTVVGGGWFGRLGWQPDASLFSWHDWVARLDAAGRWWFEALETPETAARIKNWRRVLTDLVAVGGASPPPDARSARLLDIATDDVDAHMDRVRQVQELISAGEIYQANLCGRVRGRVDGDPLLLWLRAAEVLAPRYGGWLPGAGAVPALAGWSPELFLQRSDRRVQSAPVKGTRRADPADGPAREAAARELQTSSKERAEHVMIVDLVRNDLGRVCEIGTVVVPRLLQLAPAPGLWHLVSLVEGRLREGVADAELLAATFPPGSVSGAPKVAAVEVIENLEQWPRLSYTGAYGLVGPLVGLQLAVTIRSLEIAADGAAWLGVGGGVTAGSDPRQEWEECLLKAGPIIAACGGDLSRNA